MIIENFTKVLATRASEELTEGDFSFLNLCFVNIRYCRQVIPFFVQIIFTGLLFTDNSFVWCNIFYIVPFKILPKPDCPRWTTQKSTHSKNGRKAFLFENMQIGLITHSCWKEYIPTKQAAILPTNMDNHYSRRSLLCTLNTTYTF